VNRVKPEQRQKSTAQFCSEVQQTTVVSDKVPSLSLGSIRRRKFITFVSDGGGPCNSHAIIILRN
jgi:hypothetical protein